jgi:nitrite reductase/ring-hydroxylating ferredoxin subunit
MHTRNMKIEGFKVRLAWMFASTVLLLLMVGVVLVVVGYVGSSFAQGVQPKTFSSPAEASSALFQAAQKEDEPALEAILGAGKEVTSSSDDVEDKLERERFSQKYQEMHRLVREPDGSTVLYIGAENWPFPIPLVSKNGAWYFDSKTGMQEIKFRRVGENEATAIEVCNAFVMAKKQGETKAAGEDDSISQYVQGLLSAGATKGDNNESSPFHGYYFRIVTGNSAAANDGDVAGGTKKGGLVLIAYPADYRSSGVKTFIVSQDQDNVVYEKDLGPKTATVAPSIRARSSSWHAAD